MLYILWFDTSFTANLGLVKAADFLNLLVFEESMPRFCAAINCSNRADRDKKSFFRLPAVLNRGNRDKINLSESRRQQWLIAIRRKDLNEKKTKWLWICEDHFISGKPADLSNIDSPDWVPSLNMGYTTSSKSIGAVSRHEHAHGRNVSSSTNIFNGNLANNSNIENPDLVPSINLNYPEKPQNSSYTSPHIEYIKRNIVNQNKSNGTACRNQSSLRIGITESISDKDNDVEVTRSSSMFAYKNAVLGKNIKKKNSPENNVSSEEIVLPEEFFVHSKVMTSYKNVENEGIISDEENFLSEFADNNSLLHQNMLSKKVQTDLTMIDLDKISNALKNRVNEVNQLKEKLKNLTEDILHLNEMYC